MKNQTSSFALKCEVGNHPQDLNSIFNNYDKKPSLNSLLCEDYFATYDIFSATLEGLRLLQIRTGAVGIKSPIKIKLLYVG